MVSIIIPVYNTSKYLAECIDSCFEQTYQDIEIIAINDGSTDDSAIILDILSKKDSRLKVYTQTNKGVVLARSFGLSLVSGSWIMFLDSDDILDVNAVSFLLNTAISNNTLLAIANYCEWFEELDYKRVYPFISENNISGNECLELILCQKIQWGLCSKIYHKSLFDNYCNTNFRLGEDAALLIQIIYKVDNVSLIDKVLYIYRQRYDSAVHKRNSDILCDIYYFRLWIHQYLLNNGFDNSFLLDYFVLCGYIECLLQGGYQYLTYEEYKYAKSIYVKVKPKLKLWQKMLFVSSSCKCVFYFTRLFLCQIRLFKFNICK